MLTTELKNLSRAEKLLLINDLWDDVAAESSDLELTSDQEKLLDKRYMEFQKNPDEGISWKTFKAKVDAGR
ncbi:MAG: addiction module protein [Opitutales bacterium]|nr:addiction module protein [Opitutales bacterium]